MSFFITLNLIAVIVGFVLDIIGGDPRWAWHPVRLIGQVVLVGERILYRNSLFNGALLAIFTVIIVCGVYGAVLYAAWVLSPLAYIAASAIGVWCGISVKDMKEQVGRVSAALEKNDLLMARQMLSLLVSRDTQNMDRPKIVSSAIETVGENFTDAVLSPVLYGFLAGGPGVVLFKCISTLDSMVGYRNEKYSRFGTVSARADDVLGFIPARLSIIFIMIGTFFARGNTYYAWRCYKKHRKDHPSPNSGHSIAAFAGALSIKLGGKTSYGGKIYDKPVIDGGKEPLTVSKIEKSLQIYESAAFFTVMLPAAFMWVIYVSF